MSGADLFKTKTKTIPKIYPLTALCRFHNELIAGGLHLSHCQHYTKEYKMLYKIYNNPLITLFTGIARPRLPDTSHKANYQRTDNQFYMYRGNDNTRIKTYSSFSVYDGVSEMHILPTDFELRHISS